MNLEVPSGSPFIDSLLGANDIMDGTSGALIQGVTEQQVMDALAAMARGDMEFVILSDGARFLQAAGDARSGYALEYNAGSNKEQFRATNRKIADADLQSAFRSYLRNDATWNNQFTWERFKL